MIPLFAVAVFGQGLGTTIAGLSMALFAIGNGLALLFSGKLTDKVGRKIPVMLGLTLLLLSIGSMGIFTTEAGFVICSIFAGFGGGILGPAQQASVSDVIGTGRNGGKALAGFQMCQDLGAIIGPLLAGFLADSFNYEIAFGLSALIALVGLIGWSFVPRTIKPVDTKDETAAMG